MILKKFRQSCEFWYGVHQSEYSKNNLVHNYPGRQEIGKMIVEKHGTKNAVKEYRKVKDRMREIENEVCKKHHGIEAPLRGQL